ncbi:hypothetical protein FKW77_007482 [Venturia effusa]|uniref:Uncharacterized protein n=1 Tax=Venturia effusa TaxID=50376 RepID=A0A517L9J8_9PEZI|nr:hypothetical protein FKW77_007482 [Venturia effusa]
MDEVDSLFRDVYNILEGIQGSTERLEPVAESVAVCHWTIQNLERLHRLQAQTHNPSTFSYVFDISRNLERFIASCSALTCSLDPPVSSTELQIGCIFGATRQTKKRKQIRELQEEFWDHQRMLNMLLANAIYMTTLDLQKARDSADSALASILRQAQKRHTTYERYDRGEEGKAQRPTESRAELLEWEFCVRRYFEYVHADQQKEAASGQASQSRQSPERQLVRRGSEPVLALAAAPGWSGCRTLASPTFGVPYSSYRAGGALSAEPCIKRWSAEGDPYNAIYTRSRRSSMASNVSTTISESRHGSFTSSYRASPISSPTAISFTNLVAAEPYGVSSSTGQAPNHPRTTGGDNWQRAWIDITNVTRDMPPNEARAYTQGRLEGLDSSLNSQLRMMGEDVLSQARPVPTRQQSAPQSSLRSNNFELEDSNEEAPSLDLHQRRAQLLRIAQPETKANSAPKAVRAKTLPVHAQRRLPRQCSKNRVSNLRADRLRQLSTIAERPMTSGSKKSMAESTRSLKSILSFTKVKTPPVPGIPRIKLDNRNPSDSSLSDSSTLRGSTPDMTPRIVELDGSPRKVSSRSADRPAKEKSNLRKRTNLASKSLPNRPDRHPLTVVEETLEHTNNPMKRLSRFLSVTKKEKGLHARLSSTSSPHLIDGMQSAESLSNKVSLDAMSRKNGSRSTICLVAIQEAPDQPFQVWLNALPYIEGRATTPTPRA